MKRRFISLSTCLYFIFFSFCGSSFAQLVPHDFVITDKLPFRYQFHVHFPTYLQAVDNLKNPFLFKKGVESLNQLAFAYNFPPACFMIGRMLEQKGDFNKAYQVYDKAARQEDPIAISLRANMIYNGVGIEQSKEQALQDWRFLSKKPLFYTVYDPDIITTIGHRNDNAFFGLFYNALRENNNEEAEKYAKILHSNLPGFNVSYFIDQKNRLTTFQLNKLEAVAQEYPVAAVLHTKYWLDSALKNENNDFRREAYAHAQKTLPHMGSFQKEVSNDFLATLVKKITREVDYVDEGLYKLLVYAHQRNVPQTLCFLKTLYTKKCYDQGLADSMVQYMLNEAKKGNAEAIALLGASLTEEKSIARLYENDVIELLEQSALKENLWAHRLMKVLKKRVAVPTEIKNPYLTCLDFYFINDFTNAKKQAAFLDETSARNKFVKQLVSKRFDLAMKKQVDLQPLYSAFEDYMKELPVQDYPQRLAVFHEAYDLVQEAYNTERSRQGNIEVGKQKKLDAQNSFLLIIKKLELLLTISDATDYAPFMLKIIDISQELPKSNLSLFEKELGSIAQRIENVDKRMALPLLSMMHLSLVKDSQKEVLFRGSKTKQDHLSAAESLISQLEKINPSHASIIHSFIGQYHQYKKNEQKMAHHYKKLLELADVGEIAALKILNEVCVMIPKDHVEDCFAKFLPRIDKSSSLYHIFRARLHAVAASNGIVLGKCDTQEKHIDAIHAIVNSNRSLLHEKDIEEVYSYLLDKDFESSTKFALFKKAFECCPLENFYSGLMKLYQHDTSLASYKDIQALSATAYKNGILEAAVWAHRVIDSTAEGEKRVAIEMLQDASSKGYMRATEKLLELMVAKDPSVQDVSIDMVVGDACNASYEKNKVLAALACYKSDNSAQLDNCLSLLPNDNPNVGFFKARLAFDRGDDAQGLRILENAFYEGILAGTIHTFVLEHLNFKEKLQTPEILESVNGRLLKDYLDLRIIELGTILSSDQEKTLEKNVLLLKNQNIADDIADDVNLQGKIFSYRLDAQSTLMAHCVLKAQTSDSVLKKQCLTKFLFWFKGYVDTFVFLTEVCKKTIDNNNPLADGFIKEFGTLDNYISKAGEHIRALFDSALEVDSSIINNKTAMEAIEKFRNNYGEQYFDYKVKYKIVIDTPTAKVDVLT